MFFLAVLLCLVLLCGCVDTTNLFKQLSSKKEILSALSERYGEEFTILASEKIEGEDVVRGKAWLATPQSNPELRFVVGEYVEKSYSTGPVPYFSYTYAWREYYADTAMYRALLGFLDENGIRHENMGVAPVPRYHRFSDEDINDTPSIIFTEEELEEKLPLLAEFVAGLNDICPCNREEVILNSDLFSIKCETEEGIVVRELEAFQHSEGGLFEFVAGSLTREFADGIATDRIIRQFISDFTAFCDEEGFVWYQPERNASWREYLFVYFTNVEHVKAAEPRFAAFIEEHKDKALYLSPLCENPRDSFRVHIKQVGTDTNFAFWEPFYYEGEAPPYLYFAFSYARGLSES